MITTMVGVRQQEERDRGEHANGGSQFDRRSAMRRLGELEVRSKFFVNKVMQVAIELKYQCPLLQTEFQANGCECGASARFPGPCVDCCSRELARLVGVEYANEWIKICRDEQRVWRAMEDKALSMIV